MPEPTKRQIEVLVNIYLKDQAWDGQRDYKAYPSEKDPAPIPAWGRKARYGRGSSMGGAMRRMRQRIGEAGWIEEYETERGYTYYRDKLTSAGMKVLKAAYPAIDGIDARIAEVEQAEASAAAIAAIEADNAAKARAERAEARRAARAAAMREIAQSYQISLDALSDDQCRAMWMEIIDREHQL